MNNWEILIAFVLGIDGVSYIQKRRIGYSFTDLLRWLKR